MKDEYFYRVLGVIDRLRDEIYSAGYNFCSIAKKLGKDKSSFHHIEDGVCPRVKTVYEIAKILNISFEYFLTGRNKDTFKPFVIDIDNVVKIYDKLPYEKKKHLSPIEQCMW